MPLSLFRATEQHEAVASFGMAIGEGGGAFGFRALENIPIFPPPFPITPVRVLSRSSLVFAVCLALVAGSMGALLSWRLGASPWWGVLVAALVALYLLRDARRRALAVQHHLPEAERAWLAAHVPLYADATPRHRRRFERDVQMFRAEQRFEGVRGVEATEALTLMVAAGAATLLHGRPDWALSTRRTFLFYPGHFDADYFDDNEGDFDGMAHPQGPVIFSAPAVEASWEYRNGNNVVLHELAHLLDFADNDVDGAPSLMDRRSAQAWSALVKREIQRIKIGRSMLRRYAATNHAEFFACATEAFFERPDIMARQHAELFEALSAFYAVDPRPSGDGAGAVEGEREVGAGA